MARLSDITMGEARELDRVLSKSGLTAEHARAIIRNNDLGRIMVKALMAEIKKPDEPTITSYPDVPVDYSIRSSDDFSKEFDWVSDGYREARDWQRHESCRYLHFIGKRDVAFELVHYNKIMTTEQVLDALEAKGLRPATLEEIVSFARIHPELQKEFPIVGLGSSCRCRGHHFVPYLDWDGTERCLDLHDDGPGREWREFYRFLAVCKSVPAKAEKPEEAGEQHFTVRISYELPPFAELNGTVFDWASDLFSDTYTWEEHESVRGRVDRTPGERSFLVKHFKREMHSDEVIAWADKNGYRVATHEEAVDFAKLHPNLQRQFSIVALGSFAVYDGRRYVAVLGGGGAERGLDFDWFGGRWSAHCRFLLVRK